MFEATII